MQLLRAIETKFWYLWVGIALFVAFGIALHLVPIYITGEHILAIHARVGYGVFYVDMLAPMLISCFVVLPNQLVVSVLGCKISHSAIYCRIQRAQNNLQ